MKTSFWRYWLKSIRQAKPARPISRKGTCRRTLFVETLEDRVVPSLTPQMVLDMNPTPLSSNPSEMVAIGSTSYFSADVHWTGTWFDNADGKGPHITPALVVLGDSQPGWPLWPGWWVGRRRRRARRKCHGQA